MGGPRRVSPATLMAEEDEEDAALRLKQEELPAPAEPPPLEPPREPPRDPSPAEDAEVSTIIYEIPKEPERSGGPGGVSGGRGLGCPWGALGYLSVGRRGEQLGELGGSGTGLFREI